MLAQPLLRNPTRRRVRYSARCGICAGKKYISSPGRIKPRRPGAGRKYDSDFFEDREFLTFVRILFKTVNFRADIPGGKPFQNYAATNAPDGRIFEGEIDFARKRDPASRVTPLSRTNEPKLPGRQRGPLRRESRIVRVHNASAQRGRRRVVPSLKPSLEVISAESTSRHDFSVLPHWARRFVKLTSSLESKLLGSLTRGSGFKGIDAVYKADTAA